uniref:Uncharacterized protein n=1 Tax=Homalodisca liturata TaxID=320908 RepID=A0A1B6H9L9_9HEMI
MSFCNLHSRFGNGNRIVWRTCVAEESDVIQPLLMGIGDRPMTRSISGSGMSPPPIMFINMVMTMFPRRLTTPGTRSVRTPGVASAFASALGVGAAKHVTTNTGIIQTGVNTRAILGNSQYNHKLLTSM